MRFLHTADWQIGKSFRSFGDREPLLRQARLDAIETMARLAAAERLGHVLVAGDLYDIETPSLKTLLEPLERMRRFPFVTWHVISGNHDPHRGNGLWDRVRAAGLPDNVRLHLESQPVSLNDEAILLPCPMRRKSEVSDLTAWMDDAATAPGLIRIGLAHGSITGFGAGGEANNPIAPDRARRAGLDYLALGDWHRTLQAGPSTWYAGTPETDRFNSQQEGQVLLVDIAGPGAMPIVTPRRTGRYRWLALEDEVSGSAGLDGLETRLRALPELSATLIRIVLKGTLPLSGRAGLERRLASLEAAMFHLDADLAGLRIRPSFADLEAIDFGGVLREAADTLRTMSEDEARTADDRRSAEDALIQLFLMTTSEAAP